MRLNFKAKLVAITILLFVVLFPLSNLINFQQNDDWVYYKNVSNFMQGNFKLASVTQPSFYIQGFVGAIFAKLFGISHLPILTLLVSVLNFLVFALILRRFYIKNELNVILVSLLFFFVPIHIYSILGFMTENYFLLVFLLSILLVNYFLEKFKFKYFILFNIVILIGFFIRQFSFLLAISLIPILILKKQYKYAIAEAFYVLGIIVYYTHFFNRTTEMIHSQNSTFKYFVNLPLTYGVIIASLLYIPLFLFPLIWTVTIKKVNNFSTKELLKFFGIALLIGVTIAGILLTNSKHVSRTLFYLDNSLLKNGFVYSDTLGTKYSISNINLIYRILDVLTRISFGVLVTLVIFFRKKIVNIYSIFIFVYIGFLATFLHVYDRYTLLLIPISILFLFESYGDFIEKNGRKLLILVILLFIFYDYQFSLDFVLVNKYLWSRSERISSENKIDKSFIRAGDPWIKVYLNFTKSYDYQNYKYIFYFDKNPPLAESNLKLIETYNVTFPLDVFHKSNIYFFENMNFNPEKNKKLMRSLRKLQY